ncbi:hypothetical protein L4D18_21690 [Vibrio campbellii]|uniref:hypothetical protein n=1 Tax=Vibrio campbellii TaxID=680 RepID=UPI003D0B4FB2
MDPKHNELAEIEQEISGILLTVQAIIKQAKANKTSTVQIETGILEMLLANYDNGPTKSFPLR